MNGVLILSMEEFSTQKVSIYVVIKYLNMSQREARERISRGRAGRYFCSSRLRRGCGFSFWCFVMVAVTHLAEVRVWVGRSSSAGISRIGRMDPHHSCSLLYGD